MKSSCVITFEGLNINRLLNDLCRKGFSLLAIERQGKISKYKCLRRNPLRLLHCFAKSAIIYKISVIKGVPPSANLSKSVLCCR